MNTVFALLACLAAAIAPDLNWSNHYGTARKQAIASGKPLLVVIENRDPLALPSAPTIEQISWTSPQVSPELLVKFELCRIDASTEYGRRVARAFNANKLPLTAIIDKTGEWMVYVKAGDMNTSELNDVLAEWQQGVASAEFIADILKKKSAAQASKSTDIRLCRT